MKKGMSWEHMPILNTKQFCVSEQPFSAVRNNKKTNPSYTADIDLNSILRTILQLEFCLIEDHRQDYELRIALARQTERVLDLHACLTNEKQRNQRLVNLILNVNSCLFKEDKYDDKDSQLNIKKTIGEATNRWYSKSAREAHHSVSPLLEQQSYEELLSSYNLCQTQLLKNNKELKESKCKRELLQSQYDNLMYKYTQVKKRSQKTCAGSLRKQKMNTYKIKCLQEALTYARNCIISAQHILDDFKETSCNMSLKFLKEDFQQNFQLFINTLQLSEQTCCNCCAISNKPKQNK